MSAVLSRAVSEVSGKKAVITLFPSDTAQKAIDLLPQHDAGAACVVNQAGVLVGILTIRDLLQRVLIAKKDPACVLVGDVMTSNPVSVSAATCIHETLDLMTRHGYRTVPITNEGKVVGLVDIRDIYEAIQSLLHRKLEDKASLFARMLREPYGYDPHPATVG